MENLVQPSRNYPYVYIIKDDGKVPNNNFYWLHHVVYTHKLKRLLRIETKMIKVWFNTHKVQFDVTSGFSSETKT